MLPTDRPVLGRDLDAVRQQFGLLTADMIWVLGISITRWMQVVRQAPDEPVKDTTLALLVRFLAEHPELPVVPRFPTPQDMLALLGESADVDARRLAVMLGSEVSAGYRWMRQDARPSSTVNRLMHYLRMALLREDGAGRTELVEAWRRTVEQEARCRGVDDVFRAGSWTRRPANGAAANGERFDDPSGNDDAHTPSDSDDAQGPAG